MKLIVLHTDYGTQRYFQFYLKDGHTFHCVWSKQFSTKDEVTL